jgi:beta-glucanase (GH16 family)
MDVREIDRSGGGIEPQFRASHNVFMRQRRSWPIEVLLFCLLAVPLRAASDWKLIWSDEFNGEANSPPDPTKWTYDLGDGGWGNGEREVYTDSPENVFQDGAGHLVIRAQKTPTGYTSARIKTQNRFTVQYGKIEARIKIGKGQGLWPAFWMLGDNIVTAPWPECGEIDILENVGKEPAVAHGTANGPGYSGMHGIGEQTTLHGSPPLGDDFHIYSVEWSRHKVRFLIDGKAYNTVTPRDLPDRAKWVYDHPFYLLLNMAVGGSWPGNPDQSTVFPNDMLIDWVRVSQTSE